MTKNTSLPGRRVVGPLQERQAAAAAAEADAAEQTAASLGTAREPAASPQRPAKAACFLETYRMPPTCSASKSSCSTSHIIQSGEEGGALPLVSSSSKDDSITSLGALGSSLRQMTEDSSSSRARACVSCSCASWLCGQPLPGRAFLFSIYKEVKAVEVAGLATHKHASVHVCPCAC